MFVTCQDSRWTEISASLRKGTLYVKMPREKVILFIQQLAAEEQDLLQKEILESSRAFVFYGPTDDWNEDLITLKGLKPSGIVTEFVLAVEAGLRNEDQLDWVSRIGGPPREPSDALDSLFGDDVILELPEDMLS